MCKTIRKTKEKEREEKYQNEPCLPSQQTTCSQKKLKN